MKLDLSKEKEWFDKLRQDFLWLKEKVKFDKEMVVNEVEIKLPVVEKEIEKVAPVIIQVLQRSGHMGWAEILASVLKLVPYVAAGVEVIHSGESTETKAQITQDVINVAVAGATQVLSTTNAAQAQSIGGAVNAIIAAATTKPAPIPAPAPVNIPAPTPIV